MSHIQPSRVHRIIGAKIVAGKWNAEVKHQPLEVVTRSRWVRSDWDTVPAIIIAVASAFWMITAFYWLFRLNAFGFVVDSIMRLAFGS